MLSQEVRDHIEARMQQSNVDPKKVGLDVEDLEPGKMYREVVGIYGGALDEEFFLDGIYEVNVADWLAEFYEGIALTSGSNEDWQVEVYEAFCGPEDLEGNSYIQVDNLIYRKSSDD
jgi:hypothetical protein